MRVLALLVVLSLGSRAAAQDPLFWNEELLHTPTQDAVMLTLRPAQDLVASVAWGAGEPFGHRSPPRRLRAGKLAVFRLDGLSPGGEYAYRVTVAGQPERPAHAFRTLRAPGEKVRFAVAADTHAWAVWSKAVCGHSPPGLQLLDVTLDNLRADGDLDFLVLGSDTVMAKCGSCAACEVDGLPAGSKTIESALEVELRYRKVFSPDLLGRVAADLPLLVLLGDHDGEQGWLANEIPQWSRDARLAHLANPYRVYGGGVNGNYYALRTGEVLLVVLDVHRHTLVPPTTPEDWTLGATQLGWLERTLRESDATFKVVLAEHLLGGLSDPDATIWKGRGGLRTTHDGEVTGTFVGEQALVHEILVEHGAQVFFSFQDHVVAWGQKLGSDGSPQGVHYLMGGRASGVVPPATGYDWYQTSMDYDGDGVPEYDTGITGTKTPGYFRVTAEGRERLLFEYVVSSQLAAENGQVLLAFEVGP